MEGNEPARVSTGIAGLDEILNGGFVSNRTYLLTGPPGGGKTTIGWHFLTAGSRAGEPVLFLTFSEPRADLVQNARLSGFVVDDVAFCDLSPSSELFSDLRRYDIFPASEVELEPTTEAIMAAVREVRPTRVFVDSMTALRYLSRDDADFRRQTLAFLRFLKEQGCTVVLTSEASGEHPDDDLRFLADGVIEVKPNDRTRAVAALKFRGSDYHAGVHTLLLDARGATVFPRLRPDRHHVAFNPEMLSWGVEALDALSHGGLERGTVTLVSGPSGVGKSTVGTLFVKEAARRGERSAIYSFDERAETLVARCESVNIPLRAMIAEGTLRVESIEALRYSADEFANLVRRDVEENGTRVVMIDSISGYRLSVSNDNIHERLHELCRYLQNMGATVILVNELVEIADFKLSEVGITYLADNVVILRYLELHGYDRPVMGRALGVLKKRLSDFEKSMHVFRLSAAGIAIGDEPVSIGPLLGGASVLNAVKA